MATFCRPSPPPALALTMDASSYVKAPPRRRFGLRERLLLGLLLAALGTVMVAVVGWVSFQRVVASQQAIVRDTLPAADALHETVRGNARLAALAPRLGRVESRDELAQLQAALEKDLALVRERLDSLSAAHVEAELRSRLMATASRLAERLRTMADTVGARLLLREASVAEGQRLRVQVDALDALARTQSDNATALLVSTLTVLLQDGEASSAAIEAVRPGARDRLLDLDLDALERMHELVLAAHALGGLLDRLDEVDGEDRLRAARQAFDAERVLLGRRLRDIADPGGRAEGEMLHAGLGAALAPAGAFALRGQEIALRSSAEGLQAEIGQLTTELDALAGELIHRGGRLLAAAGLAAERSATSGLVAFGAIGGALLLVTALVIIHVLRRHTLGRLLALEEATLALAAGRRDVVIDTAGDDEIASLSRALVHFRNDALERDRLAEALREQQQALERQVAERTAELRSSNAALAIETAEHASARTAAERADRAKTAFLGTVSHELRTPMAGILGLLELLEDSPLQPEQHQYAVQMRAAAVLLLELLEDMLDFARIEAGGVHVERSVFSLRDTVNDVFAVQGTRAAARGLALVADIAPAVPDLLHGDRRKLSQILLNLVGNAIKFSDEGAVTVHITRGARPDTLFFAVQDHGIGIDPERQREVFEPFMQVRDSGRHHAGTGLGLAVCKRLVEAMGGQIGLQSRLGEGTTVHFELYFERQVGVDEVQAQGEQGERAGEDRVQAANASSPYALPTRQRVLVVEDDAVNRMVIERFLEALGQEVLSAPDIHHALEIAASQPLALALIDMNLPDGDGRELLARLRSSPATRDLPAVLMSAHVPAQEVQALLRAGFAAFLPKPFSRAQLRSLLSGLLHGAAPLAPVRAVMADNEVQSALDPTAAVSAWVDLAFLRSEQAALGTAAVADIAAVFERQGDTLLAELEQAAAQGDAMGCARHAHKLRGAAQSIGLVRLGELAADFELECKAGGERLGLGVASLADAYQCSLRALHQVLGSGG